MALILRHASVWLEGTASSKTSDFFENSENKCDIERKNDSNVSGKRNFRKTRNYFGDSQLSFQFPSLVIGEKLFFPFVHHCSSQVVPVLAAYCQFFMKNAIKLFLRTLRKHFEHLQSVRFQSLLTLFHRFFFSCPTPVFLASVYQFPAWLL